MILLNNLYERSVGSDLSVNYDAMLERFRCISDVSDITESRLMSCSFAKKPKNGHILASARENGEIIISNTKLLRPGCTDYYKITQAHENAVYSVAWSEIDMKLVSASGDNSACLWDVNNDGTLEYIDTFSYHRWSVKTACFKPQNKDVFATGGYYGEIFVWDTRTITNTPDQYICNCREPASVLCLTFQDDVKLFSCRSKDTNINVWDLRKTYLNTKKNPVPLYQIPSPKNNSAVGFSHLLLDKSATRLYARSLGHAVYCFNVATFPAVQEITYLGHKASSCSDKLSLSSNGRYLASTGSDMGDSNVLVWKIRSPSQPLVKLGAEKLDGLSDISWCPENELMLATSSDDPLPWIWSIPFTGNGKHAELDEGISQSSQFSTQSYVERLHVRKEIRKRRYVTTKSLSRTQKPTILESYVLPTLPNGYESHVCEPVKKPKQICWLTGSEEVEHLGTPKYQRRKGVKRKRSALVSPSNNLFKYLNARRRTDNSHNKLK